MSVVALQTTDHSTVRPGMDQAILSKERVESHLCPSPWSARQQEKRGGTWNENQKMEGGREPQVSTTARISIGFKRR